MLVWVEGREHKLVYYVSHIFQGPKTRYTKVEKFALTVVISTWCLRPYFEVHQVTVLNNQLLRIVLYKPDVSGWMMKYALELSAYVICYKVQEALKTQVLVDYVVEYTGLQEEVNNTSKPK